MLLEKVSIASYNNAQILYTDIRILFKIYPLSPVFLLFYVKVYIILDLITPEEVGQQAAKHHGN
jgi:phage shock protein PspC (stress-responsive transcriptional regulator)